MCHIILMTMMLCHWFCHTGNKYTGYIKGVLSHNNDVLHIATHIIYCIMSHAKGLQTFFDTFRVLWGWRTRYFLGYVQGIYRIMLGTYRVWQLTMQYVAHKVHLY